MEQDLAKNDGSRAAQGRRMPAPPKHRPEPAIGFFLAKIGSPQERREAGKALRDKVPRESHAEWKKPGQRPDPVSILLDTNKGRLPELVPIRHSRMLTSPFAFLRGSAAVMAADLSKTPISGIRVQACGDCHLMNFGGFATPERQLFFDINDFDETLPAPWEWDVKRLAASIVVAGRHIDLKERESLAAATAAVRSYRSWMARYADMGSFEVWYDNINVEEIIASLSGAVRKRVKARIAKAQARSVAEYDFPKLTERSAGHPRIRDNPPLIYHLSPEDQKKYQASALKALKIYRQSLPDHCRVLLDRFSMYDLAIKVVGVGSVGTQCMIALFMASETDPMFLQVKQANPSVLEPYAGRSAYANHGQRVVMGQRLMQAASDIMLGWTVGRLSGGDFYVRQLRDMKVSAIVEMMEPSTLKIYAKLCGRTLARAHARSGDPLMISTYLGNSSVFDEAITKFAKSYADQTERDHKLLAKAVADGRVDVATD
jgi:uncharacterized protein (DUF2252 family)